MACNLTEISVYSNFPSPGETIGDFSRGSCFPWPWISLHDWTSIAERINAISKSINSHLQIDHPAWMYVLPLVMFGADICGLFNFRQYYSKKPCWFFVAMMFLIGLQALYDVAFFWNFFWDSPWAVELAFYVQASLLFLNLFLDVWSSFFTFLRLNRQFFPRMPSGVSLCLYLGFLKFALCYHGEFFDSIRLDLDLVNQDRMQLFKDVVLFSHVISVSSKLFFILCGVAKLMSNFGEISNLRTTYLDAGFKIVWFSVVGALTFYYDFMIIFVRFDRARFGLGMRLTSPTGVWFTAVAAVLHRNLDFYFYHTMGRMWKSEFRHILCVFDFDLTTRVFDFENLIGWGSMGGFWR